MRISQHCLDDLRGPCPDSFCECDCHVPAEWRTDRISNLDKEPTR